MITLKVSSVFILLATAFSVNAQQARKADIYAKDCKCSDFELNDRGEFVPEDIMLSKNEIEIRLFQSSHTYTWLTILRYHNLQWTAAYYQKPLYSYVDIVKDYTDGVYRSQYRGRQADYPRIDSIFKELNTLNAFWATEITPRQSFNYFEYKVHNQTGSYYFDYPAEYLREHPGDEKYIRYQSVLTLFNKVVNNGK